MLERVLVAIRAARPGMSLRARAIIEAVLLSRGSIGTAQEVSGALGLTNRFQLARLLEHDGLPPLHRITEWVTVLNWIALAECEQVSLCWMAFRCHRHPSSCYRLVKKVTGHCWEYVIARGADWALRMFLREFRVWARRGRRHAHDQRRQPRRTFPPVTAQGRRHLHSSSGGIP